MKPCAWGERAVLHLATATPTKIAAIRAIPANESLCTDLVGSTVSTEPVISLTSFDSSLFIVAVSCSDLSISSTFWAFKRICSSRNFSRSAARCSLRCFSAKRRRSFSATLRSISTRYLSKMAASASSLIPNEEPVESYSALASSPFAAASSAAISSSSSSANKSSSSSSSTSSSAGSFE
uniref:Uncharacterized protein n=1 Tax=Glossina austeni TaxID=7395 RepID=A0A1A9UUB9_GLOAU